MIETNMSNTKSNYPFAIVGINLTLLMIEVLHIRDQQFATVATCFWDLFTTPTAFYEIFNTLFIHIDNLWTYRKAVRSDFAAIIGEVKQLLLAILKKGPKNILEFKAMAEEEGLFIAD